jgi:hypothetical protein
MSPRIKPLFWPSRRHDLREFAVRAGWNAFIHHL